MSAQGGGDLGGEPVGGGVEVAVDVGSAGQQSGQAVSIAIDWEEYAKIFPKKAGDTATKAGASRQDE